MEAVLSHKKSKKDANLNVTVQGIFFNVVIDLSFVILPNSLVFVSCRQTMFVLIANFPFCDHFTLQVK